MSAMLPGTPPTRQKRTSIVDTTRPSALKPAADDDEEPHERRRSTEERRRSLEKERGDVKTAAGKTGDVPMTHPLIQIVGRHAWRDDTLGEPRVGAVQTGNLITVVAVFDWSGICVIAMFQGTSVSVKMNGNGSQFNGTSLSPMSSHTRLSS